VSTPESRERGWRNQPVVREHDAQFTRWLWRTCLGIVVAFAPAGAYLVCKNACVELKYEVHRLSAEHEQLIEDGRRINAERAALEAPSRIEAWALEQPALIRPDAGEIFIVKRESDRANPLVAGLPGKAE